MSEKTEKNTKKVTTKSTTPKSRKKAVDAVVPEPTIVPEPSIVPEATIAPMATSATPRISDAVAQQTEKYGFIAVPELDDTRQDPHPQTRLATARQAALAFRERMLAGPQARFYRSMDLVRVPYPTRYGLLNATTVPTPLLHIFNRLFIVQFDTVEGVKTLLFSPSDIDGNRETPFFKQLSEKAGSFAPMVNKFIAPIVQRVEDALQLAGIRPEQVDYISYDHLHTQDVRKWLGTANTPGYFPNAKLLVMKQEWDSTLALLPPQAYWYCPNGIAGIPPESVVLLEQSVILGEGVALVQSPGHTEGNHSLVVNTLDGLLVTSENGISADNYSPLHSAIPGVRDYALRTGMEVILNGNTLERGLDQYISMVVEKTIAGPCKHHPDFFNFVPSSELTAYWGFPGVKPSFNFGQLQYGMPVV